MPKCWTTHRRASPKWIGIARAFIRLLFLARAVRTTEHIAA
jgi:hypothetical protein